jgi:4'-phosphopantetheinyl transferase
MPSAADPPWIPGPERPPAPAGDVHVWRADLAAIPDELCGLLCGEERARAERLLSECGRQLWMRSRAVLRALLGRYLQRDPRELRFATGTHGKPALSVHSPEPGGEPEPTPSAGISFNLSHSGRLALYAFAATGAVGVDVELSRRPIDAVAIAARTFGPAEAERLAGLDPVTRQREFLRAWVRHEAALKCLGVGIGGADAGVEEPKPWVAELDVGPGTAAAVAVETPPQALHCWEWSLRTDAERSR